MRESDLEDRVVRLCREEKIYCRKLSSPAQNGLPDRLLIKNGCTLLVELKATGEKPTALQARELRLIQEHGGLSTYCDSIEKFRAIVALIFG